MSFYCYSQRLLNPYRGIINCIRYRSAEAVSADGVHWDIYVSNEALQDAGAAPVKAQVSDIRYGKWSAHGGLKRGPIFPSAAFRAMEDMGATVYEHLLKVRDDAPFDFADRFELWLLDADSRPLALLDSALGEDEIDMEQAVTWKPGLECRRTFTSSVSDESGIPATAGAVADYLATYVNSRTASRSAAQLFERAADGSGAGLGGINLDDSLANRKLRAVDFPVNLLEIQRHDAAHRQLLGDFIGWQAPWLLLLHTLAHDTRRQYEETARVQAVKTAGQYRLYPEIINQAVIDAALVEARLRVTMPEQQQDEVVLSPFYVELNPETNS
jgi:hypothetical protein